MEHVERFITDLEEDIRENIRFHPRATPSSERIREDILAKLREWFGTDDLELINESLLDDSEYQNTWETIGIDIYDDYARMPQDYEDESGELEYEMRRDRLIGAMTRINKIVKVL